MNDMDAKVAEMARHNMRLVRSARTLRDALGQGVAVVDSVVASGQGIAGQHEDRPTEYAIPADVMDSLRAWAQLCRSWGLIDAP